MFIEVWIVFVFIESVVVFYVYMLIIESNFSIYYIIIYDYEVINIGNGYNWYFGIFIVFVDGVYVFLWIIFMFVFGEYMLIELILNS